LRAGWHQNPKTHNISTINQKPKKVHLKPDERQKRLLAAAEAETLGQGGIAAVARATGMSKERMRCGMTIRSGTTPSFPPKIRVPEVKSGIWYFEVIDLDMPKYDIVKLAGPSI
jgi:hypothetical protein